MSVKPERKLWHELKRNTPKISWTRLENSGAFGTPDLLGYNNFGHFFTLELKATKTNKVRFSPHQFAFHVKHPNNTFILAETLSPRAVNRFHMYRGSRILELDACGLKLDACSLGLEARTRCTLIWRRPTLRANDLIRIYSTREFFNAYHKKLF